MEAPDRSFPSADDWTQLLAEVGDPERGVSTHRVAFARVTARLASGHVQGIATHVDRGPCGAPRITVYATVADLPPGWGMCLIEQARGDDSTPTSLEAMALPQGRHPGGINICDGVLVVPVQHDGRYARAYLYDVASDPLYPRQVGNLDAPTTAARTLWPPLDGSNPGSASSAGIAHLGPGWEPPAARPPTDGTGDRLVAVLSDGRFLRFFRCTESDGRYRVESDPCAVDMASCATWPSRGVSHISLVDVADGWRLAAFSAERSWAWTAKLVPRSRTVDRITPYRLSFDTDGDDPLPKLDPESPVDLAWRGPKGGGHRFEMMRPSFRWGASIAQSGDDLAILTTERFGDEEAWTAPESPDPVPINRRRGARPSGRQFLQFATNLTGDAVRHLGPGHDAAADRPFIAKRVLANAASLPLLGALFVVNGGKLTKGIAALVATMVTLWATFLVDGLTWRLLFFGSGSAAGLGAIGMISVGVVERARVERWTKRRRLTVAAVSTVVGAVTVALTVGSFLAERPRVTGVMGAVAIVSISIAYNLLARQRLNDASSNENGRHRRWLFGAAIVVSPMFLVALIAPRQSVEMRVLAGSLLILCLGVLKFTAWPVLGSGATGFSWKRQLGQRATIRVLIGLTVATIVAWMLWRGRAGGDGAVSAAWLGSWIVLLVASVWGAVEYERPPPSRPYQNRLLAIGAALVVVSFGITLWAAPDPLVAVLVTGLAIGVGTLAVWPGEARFVLVAAVFVLSWAAIDTDHPVPEEPDAGRVRWVVAIGDSFISGEGASAYYEGTNIAGVDVCRRAPTAWPELVGGHLAGLEADDTVDSFVAARPVAVKSFACSGATIDEMALPQAGDPDVATPTNGGDIRQLEALETWIAELDDDDEIAYVLVSGGGNDAGFADLIKACLIPTGHCDDALPRFARQTEPVRRAMEGLLGDLDRILAATHSDATVIVNPYVDPVGAPTGTRCASLPGDSNSLIDEDEVEAIREFRLILNGDLERAVRSHSQATDSTVAVAFNTAGARVETNLCGGSRPDAGIGHNWIELQPPDEAGTGRWSRFAALVPNTRWLNNTGHPNEAGHRAIAATVCTMITAGEERGILPGCLGDGTPAAGFGSADGRDPTSGPVTDATVESWIEEQLSNAALLLGLSVGLGLLAGVLLGAVAAHQRGWRSEIGPARRGR